MTRILLIAIILFPYTNFIFAQNVGIGTNTPSEKLDVDGNLKADTIKPNALLLLPNAGTGKILTSDEIGNASWAEMTMPPPSSPPGNVGYGVWGDCETNGNISAYQPMADTATASYNYFGISVSLSGNFAIVGAHQDNEGLGAQGSASIFYHNGISWELFQKLTDPDPGAGDNLGSSVSISGNYAMVGSPNDNDTYADQGSVSFFHFDGTSWNFVEKIFQVSAAGNNRFGTAVSISGDYAMVGTPYETLARGSVSMYYFNGVNWEFIEQLTDPTGASYDFFGISINISGNRAIVGAYNDDIGGNNDQGSASIYEFNGTNWLLMQKVTTGAAGDLFGYSVAIQDNDVLIGSPGDDVSYTDQGSATFYKYNGVTWISSQYVTDIPPNVNTVYGSSAILSGSIAMIGAPYDLITQGYINQGSVYVFQKVGLWWQVFQTIYDPGGAGDLFGQTISVDGATGQFVIGAPYYANSSGKAVFGKIN